MNRNAISLPIIMSLCLKASLAMGKDDAPEVSYFADKQRGWFWYELLPEPVKNPNPKLKPIRKNPSLTANRPASFRLKLNPKLKPSPLQNPNHCPQSGSSKTWSIS